MNLWISRAKIRCLILGWLAQGVSLTPLEMRRRLIGEDAGFWGELIGPTFATIYEVLDELEKEGLITARLEPGEPARGGRAQRRYSAR